MTKMMSPQSGLGPEQDGESLRRLSAVFANAPVGLAEISLEGRYIRVNDALCAILGRSRDELLQLSVFDVTLEADLPISTVTFRSVAATGVPISIDKRQVRPDGQVVWTNCHLTRLTDDQERPVAMLAVASDLTDRRLAEERLRRSEERLRRALLIDTVGVVFIETETGHPTDVNDAFLALCGYSREDCKEPWMKWGLMTPPESRELTQSAIAQLRTTGRLCRHEIELLRKDGSRWWAVIAGQQIDEHESVLFVTDMSDRRAADLRQRVLLDELQHRSRNILGIVRSLCRRMMQASRTIEDFVERFDDRLDALSRAQDFLSRSGESSTALGDLVRAELAAVASNVEESRIVVEGPPTLLPRVAVQTMALAVHELATNALKYGALHSPTARLTIRWCVDRSPPGAPILRFLWLEEGIVRQRGKRPGGHTGFGRELIERALPYDLGAKTTYSLEETMLRCTIELPLGTEGGNNPPSIG